MQVIARRFRFCLLVIGIWIGIAAVASADQAAANLNIDQILDGIEKAYSGKGFSAAFDQEATIKAMQITDTARGELFVRRPGKMRWEYTAPEPQIIISDGASLCKSRFMASFHICYALDTFLDGIIILYKNFTKVPIFMVSGFSVQVSGKWRHIRYCFP